MAKWWVAAVLLILVGAASIGYWFSQSGGPTAETVPTPLASTSEEDLKTPDEKAQEPSQEPIVLPTPGSRMRTPSPRRLAFSADGIIEPAAVTTLLRREGTEVTDLVGKIQRQGNRLLFVPEDGSASLTLLENQVAERVEMTTGRETAAATRWRVSGTVTEYHQQNYLLLRRALEYK